MICKDRAMHRVAVLALSGVYPFELGIPARVFGASWDPDIGMLYEVVVCTLDGGPVMTNAGFSIGVDHDSQALVDADTVVVAPVDLGWPPVWDQPTGPLTQALTRVRSDARIMSICTGAYVLAAVGLLDGRRATTHWRLAEHFQSLFPAVQLDPTVLFVDDGNVLTSAGASAGVDACLHLVRCDHGSRVANQTARDCVVPPWRDGGQAQFIDRPVPEPGRTATAPTQAWALEHLDQPLSLSELAAHARMSRRTFTRRFRQETGASPGQWILRQRIELARQLLETNDLPIDQVAHRSGFGTGASLRRHLHRAIGISPQAYRQTFRRAERLAQRQAEEEEARSE
ncbi:helix-turn-helix domain-containing protein [Streptomyces sp. NPDC013178]|uniref:GlxA family transcriptional regulator n=1 Tax=Streptomyces sp. NPDC013178 TaxID=3155118 RepID=UPI0033D98F8B